MQKYLPIDKDPNDFGLQTTKYKGFSNVEDVAQGLEPFEMFFDEDTLRKAGRIWAYLQAHGLDECPHDPRPEPKIAPINFRREGEGGMGYKDKQF